MAAAFLFVSERTGWEVIMRKKSRRLAVPKNVGLVRFDPIKSLWLWAMILPGFGLGFQVLDLRLFLMAMAMTLVTVCLGHSVGLHRGIIHQSYEMGASTRKLLAWLAVMTGMGGPISWARIHAVRDYWQNQENCPDYFSYRHGLLKDFIWNMHLRFEPKDDRADQRLPSDLLSDPWLRFLEATWPLHIAALAMFLLLVAGPEAVIICVCARSAVSLLAHWVIGYFSHKSGEQRYPIEGASESGTNHFILGLLSFGEGFHNNHHAFPWSARMGLKPYEGDLGWLTIKLLEKMGLVYAVREAAES